MERTGVIIVAGGSGRRMGGALPKQFRLLAGRPVLARTIDAFAEALPGAEIVVVLPAQHVAFWRNLAARFDVAAHAVAEGGAERFHSVRCGIEALKSAPELIAVHDGVRPLASARLIRRIAEEAALRGAAIPVLRPVDSFRALEGPDEEAGSHIVDRDRLRIVQTPQIFRADLLRRAYAADYRTEFTDDASVVEAAGATIRLCAGEASNIKLTRPEDIALAEALLTLRETPEEEPDSPKAAEASEEPVLPTAPKVATAPEAAPAPENPTLPATPAETAAPTAPGSPIPPAVPDSPAAETGANSAAR